MRSTTVGELLGECSADPVGTARHDDAHCPFDLHELRLYS